MKVVGEGVTVGKQSQKDSFAADSIHPTPIDRAEAQDQILETVNRTPVIDTHEHLYDPGRLYDPDAGNSSRGYPLA